MTTCLTGPIVFGAMAVAALAIWVQLPAGGIAGKESSGPPAAGESRSLAGCRKASAQFQADVARWSSAQDMAAAWRGELDKQHRQVLANAWTTATCGDLEQIEAEYRAVSDAIPPFPEV